MLRVHPVIHTHDIPGATAFLQALGLNAAPETHRDSATVFDAGSGRLTVRACGPADIADTAEGGTSLTFDVGDIGEFARRTIEAGTSVEVFGDGPRSTARVAAPGGSSFPVQLGPRDTRAPAPPLTVVARWHTPAPESTARVLEDIGAKPCETSAPEIGPAYRAKNGGVVLVVAAERTAVELAFEYDGDVRDLLGPLTAAGVESTLLSETPGRSLSVSTPWGAQIRIVGK